MDITLLPLLLVLLASFFQGSFGIGMKYMAPLKWEAWWLVHAFVAMVFMPIGWALLVVPDLLEVIFTVDSTVLWMAMFFGFLWGIGGIMFGVSVSYTGVSITYGIVMGLAASMGSVIPLFQMENATEQSGFGLILVGVMILLVGVAITAVAGVQRDRLQKSVNTGGKSIAVGLMIAIASGVLSAFLNVGFSNATPIIHAAVDNYGVSTQNASLAAWVVVLTGAFVMNGGYALFQLIKNKTWSSFRAEHSAKAYRWAIVAGVFWFAALGVYGQGAALMGSLGPVIGWPILLGLALIISNIWAYRAGEWKNAKKPFTVLLIGLAVLIVAICILGYANY
ncbi:MULTISPECIES: L-rhamnose/proton symporter RhaT [Reichenbachiella]|uniref:L-rhamnose/proton symporter RhaT n=1 Tax=Reichenbachiella TaxID=156993 RepID=UPI000E6CFF4E|nr:MULTISPECIES: L-rhamnose/proton symporter RhaT [Reichenbachiella]MBU2912752.1 rhamnose/proton symporter RhaT [Reichenbachiella agariperforans]RJE72432.1 sugar:proton symporter [Reichenbachiella sp. MSK19-1]